MADTPSIWVDDDDAKRKLELFESLVSDLSMFWPMVVTLQRKWWKEQFESEGHFASGGWAPLSPVYALQKARQHPGKPILQATGKLRQAASRPGRIQTPHSLTLTIDDPKASYHQEGTANMPARPIAFGDPLPAVAATELAEAAAQYVAGWVRAFGAS